MPLERLNSPEVLNEEVQLLLAEIESKDACHAAELSAAKAFVRRATLEEIRRLIVEQNCDGEALLLALDEMTSRAIH